MGLKEVLEKRSVRWGMIIGGVIGAVPLLFRITNTPLSTGGFFGISDAGILTFITLLPTLILFTIIPVYKGSTTSIGLFFFNWLLHILVYGSIGFIISKIRGE